MIEFKQLKMNISTSIIYSDTHLGNSDHVSLLVAAHNTTLNVTICK